MRWNIQPLLLVLRDSAETQDLSSEFSISTPNFYHNLFALHCLSGSAVHVWCHENTHGVLQNSMHSRLVNNCKNAKFESWLQDTNKTFCLVYFLSSWWLSFTPIMKRRQFAYAMTGLPFKFQITGFSMVSTQQMRNLKPNLEIGNSDPIMFCSYSHYEFI